MLPDYQTQDINEALEELFEILDEPAKRFGEFHLRDRIRIETEREIARVFTAGLDALRNVLNANNLGEVSSSKFALALFGTMHRNDERGADAVRDLFNLIAERQAARIVDALIESVKANLTE